MSNFFDTVRGLSEAGNYSADANAARRHSQEAHSLSQNAFFHGGDHREAAAMHSYAFAAHNKLAKDSEHSYPAASAYHKELADSHYRLSQMHKAQPK
jgi:hypothetical protein